jgi:hypothetical protein
MQRHSITVKRLLLVAVAVASVAGCHWYENLWNNYLNANGDCPPMGQGGGWGAGGFGGFGGAGWGGADVSSSADVGVGVGGSASVGAVGAGGGGAQPPPPPPTPWYPRHGKWHRRVRLGEAQQAQCTPVMPMIPVTPNMVPFTTDRLRQVAVAQGIGKGMTGIQFNRAVGLAFETWVLFTMSLPKYMTPIPSPDRKAANGGGLPASVIPDSVGALSLWWAGQGFFDFPDSLFFEVKAVTGPLLPSTSRSQIRGLIDVASRSKAGVSTVPHHPPPALVFTVTGNTPIDPSTLALANQRSVAIWLQVVFEDTNTPPDNPDLAIGIRAPMNPEVYGNAWPQPIDHNYPISKLLSPTTPPVVIPNDPDPPEVE